MSHRTHVFQPRKKIEWASGGRGWAEVSAIQFSYKIEHLLAKKEGYSETEQLASQPAS